MLAAKARRGEARGALVEAFTPLIGNVARGYRGASGVGRAELMQQGVVGLLRALERYDPELETPFWAYASWWVRQAMQQLVSELSRPVVVPDRAARQLACVRNTRRVYVQVHGREPSCGELARETGIERAQVQSLIASSGCPACSRSRAAAMRVSAATRSVSSCRTRRRGGARACGRPAGAHNAPRRRHAGPDLKLVRGPPNSGAGRGPHGSSMSP